MAETPVKSKLVSQDVIFHKVLKKFGCRNVNQLKQSIMVADDVPDTDSGKDYHLVYDRANDDVYIHTTGTTYTKLNA